MAPHTSRRSPAPVGDSRPPTHPLLTVEERRVGARTVLSIIGEVDISTVAQLRAALESAGARAFEVWLDLTETTFMDSSGVHALVDARTRLAEGRLRVVLICPEGPVRRALTLTALDQFFEIHSDRSAANHAIA
jgi:anti-sigma B factor antagonist